MGKKKLYIQNESKGHAITLLAVALVVLIAVAILSLLPSRAPRIGNIEKNGVARSFLFPFVFTNENNTLFIINKNLEVNEIDDNVQNVIHDVRKDKVYYVRENTLFEYSVKKNIRNILSENVTSYMIFDDRSAILCLSDDNDLKLFRYSENNTVRLSESQFVDINNYAVAGEDYFLFVDNINELKADLFISNLNGKVRKIASGVNPAKSYGLIRGDRYVFFYTDNILNIADKNGKIQLKFDNAQIPNDTVQPAMIEVNTKYLNTKSKTDIGYVLCNILPDSSKGDLEYLNKDKKHIVTKDVNRIIFYSSDNKLIIFAKHDGTKAQIFKSSRGNEPKLITESTLGAKYIFDETQGYLYINEQSGRVTRINIYDKKLRLESVSDYASNIYSYRNKSIVLYENIESELQFYILKNNNMEKVSSNEKRLYGFSDEKYLLLRSVTNGNVTLDLVTVDGIKRITGDLRSNLFYDKNLDEILYTADNVLLYWKNNKSIEIGKFTKMLAVTVAE